MDLAIAKEILESTQWCCKGRHGALLNIPPERAFEVSEAITYFFGGKPNKGQWWKKNADGTYSVEFNHQCKVYPPPAKPWEWCGKTILFERWQKRELAEKKLASIYHIGDTVSFTFKGIKKIGVIARKSKRASIVIPGERQTYLVPFPELELE